MSPSPIKRLKPYFKPRPRTPPGRRAAGPRPPPSRPRRPPRPRRRPARLRRRRGSRPQPRPRPCRPRPRRLNPPPPRRARRRRRRRAAARPQLVARREQLSRRYAELQSDLGGLVYEMAIRDHFRLDVLVRRAAELQAVDAELSSVEQALGLATPAPAAVCPACRGAGRLGAQYCGRCGSTLARTGVPSTPVSANAATPPSEAATRRERRRAPRRATPRLPPSDARDSAEQGRHSAEYRGDPVRIPGRLIRGSVRPDRRSLARFASLRWAALPIVDRRWTAPMSAVALGFGLFVGVAIGPGTEGSLGGDESDGDRGSAPGEPQTATAPPDSSGGDATVGNANDSPAAATAPAPAPPSGDSPPVFDTPPPPRR